MVHILCKSRVLLLRLRLFFLGVLGKSTMTSAVRLDDFGRSTLDDPGRSTPPFLTGLEIVAGGSGRSDTLS